MSDMPVGTVAFLVVNTDNEIVNRVVPVAQAATDAYADLVTCYPSPGFTIQFFSDLSDPAFTTPVDASEQPTPTP